jgi:hypothetical protein
LKKGLFRRKKDQVIIRGKIITGTKPYVNSSLPEKVSYMISIGDSLNGKRKYKGATIKNFFLPQILERDNFYIPLTIKTTDKKTFFMEFWFVLEFSLKSFL